MPGVVGSTDPSPLLRIFPCLRSETWAPGDCASGEPRFKNGFFVGYSIFIADMTDAEETARQKRCMDTLLATVTENCPALIVLKDVVLIHLH